MAWNNGNPHYIASLAHLDCKGVSPQNVWIPMEANYSVSGRSYTITVKLYMWWNKRIRLYMTFHDMSINGTNFGNKNIVGWVDKPLEFGSATYHGTFDKNGNPDRADWTFNGSGFINVYTNVGCSRSRRVDLSNSINLHIDSIQAAYTKPGKPTVNPVSATDTSITADASVNDFGVGVKNALYVQASETNFGASLASPSISSKSGQMTVPNLSRNTRYYVRSVADNGGMSNVSDVKEKVTLAASEVLELFAVSPTQVDAKVAVYNGSGYYKPTTYVEISSDNGKHWVQQGSTKSTTVATVPLTPLVANKRYWVRTKTVTTAGTYYSDMKPVTTPRFLTGRINNVTPTGSEAIINVTASSSACADIVATPYYRIKGVGDAYQAGTPVNMKSGQTVDLRISDLLPNYITYEIYVKFKDCADNIYDTEPVDFATISSIPVNHNCESLNYMVDLICQSLEAIKEGNITVFANDDTKTWCEEEDDDTPTLASMLSRVTRFMQAVSCILCSMGGLMAVKHGGKPGQVFMGQLGWQNMDGKPTEGSGQLVSSNAVYEAVQNVIHSVWHPFGIYDFYGYDLAELQTQKGVKNGQTGVVGGKVYTWNGTAWGSPKDINADNFGVIHINYGKYEREAFYWFGNSWSRLNADTDKIEKWIDLWEDVYPVYPESGAYLEVEGNPIEIKNAIDAPIHKLEVDGDTTQVIGRYKGWQCMQEQGFGTPTDDSNFWVGVARGEVSPLKDGWCLIKSDIVKDAFFNVMIKGNRVDLEPDTRYTVFVESNNKTNENDNIVICQSREEEVFVGATSFNIQPGRNVYKAIVTTRSDLTDKVFRTFVTAFNTNGINCELRISVREGDHMNEAFSYEPYTGGIPTPSPLYPEEPDDIVLKSITNCRKNLLNAPSELIVKGLMYFRDISLKAGTVVTISVKSIVSDHSPINCLMAFATDGDKFVSSTYFIEGKKSATITLRQDVNRFLVYSRDGYTQSQDVTTTFSNLQIEIGEKATEYEPYNGKFYNFSQPIHVRKVGTTYIDKLTKIGNEWGVMRKTNMVTITGAESPVAWAGANTSKTIALAYSDNIYNGRLPYFDTWATEKAKSSHFKDISYTVWGKDSNAMALNQDTTYSLQLRLERSFLRLPESCSDAQIRSAFIAWLTKQNSLGTPVNIRYAVKTPFFEPLPQVDQDHLNMLQSFKGTTIIATQGKMRVQYAIDLKEYQGDASEVIVDNYVVATANVSASDADLMSSVPTNPNKDTIIYILEDE